MSNQWLRLWHDAANDPKWRTISKLSGRPISEVMAVYMHHLVSASQNTIERGVTQCNAEDLSSALDIEINFIEAINSAMQGRVLDGNKLRGWEKRQPKREDDSKGRVAKLREKEKLQRNVTQCNAPDKDTDKIKKEAKASSVGFEKFWTEYPTLNRTKGSQKKALAAYEVALTKTEPETILEGVKSYAAYLRNSGQSNADAFRWLQDERWGDDYSYAEGNPKPGGETKLSRLQRAAEIARAKREQREQGQGGLPATGLLHAPENLREGTGGV